MRAFLLVAILLLAGCTESTETAVQSPEEKPSERTSAPESEDSKLADAGFDYVFSITSDEGSFLGTGKIDLPFKLGEEGNGVAPWEFTLRDGASSTNENWRFAKRRFLNGEGKANASGADRKSALRLDFSPEYRDNNVIVVLPVTNQTMGIVYFQNYSGNRRCASFRITEITEP
jgi:hypothetical protein